MLAIHFSNFSKGPILLHLWKRSLMTLEETPNQSRWRAFHWHPVQSTYQIALATALSDTLGLPPRLLLFLLFLGRCFLSFLHRGRGRRKYSTLLCVVASLTRRVSFADGKLWQTHSRRDAPLFKLHGEVLG